MSAISSGFQLAHAIGQQPKRTIEADVLVDAADRPGLLAAAIGAASAHVNLGQVFLRAVEYAPQIRAAVINAPQHQNLQFSNRRKPAQQIETI